jgi:hypothetical protein
MKVPIKSLDPAAVSGKVTRTDAGDYLDSVQNM